MTARWRSLDCTVVDSWRHAWRLRYVHHTPVYNRSALISVLYSWRLGRQGRMLDEHIHCSFTTLMGYKGLFGILEQHLSRQSYTNACVNICHIDQINCPRFVALPMNLVHIGIHPSHCPAQRIIWYMCCRPLLWSEAGQIPT